MSKARKASWITLVAYCFVWAFGFGNSANSHLKHDSSKDHNLSSEVAELRGLTVSFSQLDKSTEGPSSTLSRANYGDYLSSVKIAETLTVHLHSKYIAFARDKVCRFQSRDIIFPFHYFW